MRKNIYFILVEILSAIFYTPVVYSYGSYVYSDASKFDIGVVILVIIPVLSSVTASYRYELKYHEFISIKNLMTSSVLLYLPHVVFAGIGIYVFDGTAGGFDFILDSMVVAVVQVIFITASVILFGKHVNNALLRE